ncbi:MAG: flagellar basal body-associated FliL family protein [Treponema sp.]|jgi:flagellar basal body-associated protein FliL|nr:flagellar basal body-associated FliL family protein [Treponema sp.]
MKAGPPYPIKPPRDVAYPAPRTVPRTAAPAKPATPPPPKKGATRVYHTLILVAVLLALLIAAGTIYALVFRNSTEPLYSIPAAPTTAAPTQTPFTDTQVFQLQEIFPGIGRLRAVSADKPPVTIVVSIAFPYLPEDRPFTEELTAKIPEFRNTTLEYFSTHSAVELRQSGEAAIKTNLLRRYNNLLRLGSISTLYFNDFMFID